MRPEIRVMEGETARMRVFKDVFEKQNIGISPIIFSSNHGRRKWVSQYGPTHWLRKDIHMPKIVDNCE